MSKSKVQRPMSKVCLAKIGHWTLDAGLWTVLNQQPAHRKYQAGDRGRIATCCALREFGRDRDLQQPARPGLAALLLQTAHVDRRSNSVRKIRQYPTAVRD